MHSDLIPHLIIITNVMRAISLTAFSIILAVIGSSMVSALPTSPFQTLERRNNDDLLTVVQVAQMLRVDDTTVRRWVKQGILEAVALPHVDTRQGYRIKRKTVEKLLKSK